MKINIDNSAGFCWGVVQTIDKVEAALQKFSDKQIYVLGEIIHNPHEIERLTKKKLITIDYDSLEKIHSDSSIVVIRAHGEPPTTYKMLNKCGLGVIDATCPLVKRLQEKISNYYQNDWQIVIFGKYNHAEVIGLRGFCNDECIVVKDFEEAIDKIDFNLKTVLLSQTTMNANVLNAMYNALNKEFLKQKNPNEFILENTVCRFMYNKEEELVEFAKRNELILFVAGHHSSNGKVLFDICKSQNLNTFFIENYDDIDIKILENVESVGITGATSTPKWLLEEMKIKLERAYKFKK